MGQRSREDRILKELQEAVTHMHVLSAKPRIVFAEGKRGFGPRPMAWQVLFERSFGPNRPTLRFRGTSAQSLAVVLARGYDDEPSINGAWAHERLDAAMLQGPVIQAFRADRLPDDVENALVGILIFQEDGLRREGVSRLLEMSQPLPHWK